MSPPPSRRFDEWGIRAAEQLETSVGPWVALASFKRLLVAPSPVRERAILGALRCAVSLGGSAEVGLATDLWAKADRNYQTDEPLRIAMRELESGRERFALLVADAELERRPSARAAYAAARVYGATRAAWRPTEAGMLEKAQALAGTEGSSAVAAAAAARRIEILHELATRNPEAGYRREALAIAEGVTLEGAPGAVRLVVARAQLLAPGRFVRAGALSTLSDLVRRADDVAREAAHAIARHVDAMGARLTPVEAERALAGFAAMPEGPARDEAVRRTRAVIAIANATGSARTDAARAAARGDAGAEELVVRARALAAGSPMTSHATDRFDDAFVTLAALGLDVLGAMASDKHTTAAQILTGTASRVGPGEAIPAPLWTAVLAGLSSTGLTRSAAAHLGARLVSRAAGEPPYGFLALGQALALANAGDASRLALDLAARAREPGAKESLARAASLAAWRAYDAGDPTRARTLLLEARRVASGS